MSKSNILIFLGPPGSGKGSISKLLVKRLGWSQLSTGNLCREHIAKKSEIGKEIDLIIKSGKLISDSLIIRMVEDWLLNKLQSQSSVILDGFPRTKAQAKALSNFIDQLSINSLKLYIIRLVIPESSIILRLSSRAVCSNNKCQAVYSLKQSGLKPKNADICDECSSCLIRRDDDAELAVIKNRLDIYQRHEKDIINFFITNGKKIEEFSAEETIESLYQRFLGELNISNV